MTETSPKHHVVLLGDSIFDNAVYVPDGPAVIDHLRKLLPADWKSTLLACDGDVIADVAEQLPQIPEDATHLCISVGGNDAIMAQNSFAFPAGTVYGALGILADVQRDFRLAYRAMLWQVLSHELPVAVCTIYDAVPGLPQEARTGLSLFNDVITREAAAAGVPVIDLRHVCKDEADYSPLSPIEPSEHGGRKIACAIVDWLAAKKKK